MQYLRWFFGLDRIYYSLALGGVLFNSFILVGVVGVLSSLLDVYARRFGVAVYIVLYGVAGFILLREIVQSLYVAYRLRSDRARGFLNNSLVGTGVVVKHKSHLDHSVEIVLLADNATYQLYDLVINYYRRTKNGRYVHKRLTQTVFEAKLQRNVPNLVFDHKNAHGRQFRGNFLRKQRVNFEAKFNDVYDSYSPSTYHIDTLSFITPEVMDAMLKLGNVDVEFIGDRLLCYGPLTGKTTLSNFTGLCLSLFQSVDNNLDTYRDDRLSGESRRTKVTSFASNLLESPWKHVTMLIVTGIASISFIAGGLYMNDTDIALNRLSIATYLTMGIYIYRILKIISTNKKAEEDFERFMRLHEEAVEHSA